MGTCKQKFTQTQTPRKLEQFCQPSEPSVQRTAESTRSWRSLPNASTTRSTRPTRYSAACVQRQEWQARGGKAYGPGSGAAPGRGASGDPPGAPPSPLSAGSDQGAEISMRSAAAWSTAYSRCPHWPAQAPGRWVELAGAPLSTSVPGRTVGPPWRRRQRCSSWIRPD